jgi:hypothetical protein
MMMGGTAKTVRELSVQVEVPVRQGSVLCQQSPTHLITLQSRQSLVVQAHTAGVLVAARPS